LSYLKWNGTGITFLYIIRKRFFLHRCTSQRTQPAPIIETIYVHENNSHVERVRILNEQTLESSSI